MPDPTRDRGWGEYRLGIVVTSVVTMVVVTVLLLGSQRGPFLPDTLPYYLELDDAAGIRVGSFVRVGGMPAGEVRDVEIVPPRPPQPPVAGEIILPPAEFRLAADIRIEIQVEEGFERHITSSSRAQLTSLGLGGERYVRITAGDVREAPLVAGSTIAAMPSADWDLILAKLARALNEAQVLAAVGREVGAEIAAGGGTAGKLLDADAELYSIVSRAADDAERLLAVIDSGPGIVGRYRRDPTLRTQIASLKREIEALDSLRKAPDSGYQRWGSPTELEAVLADAGTQAEAVRFHLDSAHGTLGRLAHDEELQRQLRVLQARVADLARAFRDNPLGFINIEIF